jgi:hypothetical protein
MNTPTPPPEAPRFLDFDVEALAARGDALEAAYDGRLTGLVVRRALPADLVARAAAALQGSTAWTSPNQGMRGGRDPDHRGRRHPDVHAPARPAGRPLRPERRRPRRADGGHFRRR